MTASRTWIRLSRATGVLLLAGLAACSTARTLEIATDPAGATIWINGELQSSPTPVTVPFTHYGYLDVRVEMPGYQSLATQVAVPSEWDGYPIVDLPLELMVPSKHFRRTLRLERLPPKPGPAEAEAFLAKGRAQSLRGRAQDPKPAR